MFLNYDHFDSCNCSSFSLFCLLESLAPTTGLISDNSEMSQHSFTCYLLLNFSGHIYIVVSSLSCCLSNSTQNINNRMNRLVQLLLTRSYPSRYEHEKSLYYYMSHYSGFNVSVCSEFLDVRVGTTQD